MSTLVGVACEASLGAIMDELVVAALSISGESIVKWIVSNRAIHANLRKWWSHGNA
jgi:hypothetical protein